jgi:hypothetical protein
MTVIMSTLLSNNSIKQEIEPKLFEALRRLVDRALYNSSELSFFVPKTITRLHFDTVQLNLYLLDTIQEFNRHASKEDLKLPLPVEKMRNFFLQKAMFTSNTRQIYFSL